MASKKNFKTLFEGRTLDYPLFIPILTTFASRLSQVPLEKLMADPTKLANAMQSVHKLLKLDAITAVWDPSIESEILGCTPEWNGNDGLPEIKEASQLSISELQDLSITEKIDEGRLGIAMEAFHRLVALHGRDVAMVGVVTGPTKIVENLLGRSFTDLFENEKEALKSVLEVAGRVVHAVARKYCEIKADAILINDSGFSNLQLDAKKLIMPIYRSMTNIVHFFDAYVILDAGAKSLDDVEFILRSDIDALLVEDSEFSREMNYRVANDRASGVALKISDLVESEEAAYRSVRKCIASIGKKGCFISTAGDLPAGISVQTLQEVARLIRAS